MAASVAHHISIKEVFLGAWEIFKKYWKEVLLFSVISTIINVLFIQFVLPGFDPFVRFVVFNILLTSFLFIPQAFVLFLIDKKERKHAFIFKKALRHFSSLLVPLLLVSLLYNSMVYLGEAMFIIPGIICRVFFGQAAFFVLFHKSSVRDAFSKSMILTKGNRMNLLKIIFLLFFFYLAFFLLIGRSLGEVGAYVLSFIFVSITIVVGYMTWAALQNVNPTK